MSGRCFVLKRGFRHLSRGDMLCTVRINVPKTISELPKLPLRKNRSPERNARKPVSYDEVMRAIGNIEENQGNLRRLVTQIKTLLRVIPFIGAGMSVPYGFPGWTKFLLSQGRKVSIEDKLRKRINAGEYEYLTRSPWPEGRAVFSSPAPFIA